MLPGFPLYGVSFNICTCIHWFQMSYHGTLSMDILSTTRTYANISFRGPTRLPSAKRSLGPPQPVPTSASVVKHPLCREPQETPGLHPLQQPCQGTLTMGSPMTSLTHAHFSSNPPHRMKCPMNPVPHQPQHQQSSQRHQTQ